MELIKKKIEESIKIVDLFKDYINYFEVGFNKVRPKIVNDIKDLINTKYPERRRRLSDRLKALDVLSELEPEQQQKLIFQIYSLLQKFDDILNSIYKIIDQYSFATSEFVDSNLSSTTKYNSISQELIVKKHYIDYLKTYKNITETDITDKFSNIIIDSMTQIDVKKKIEYINSLFEKYPNTIQLFSHIIQSLLDMHSRSKELINFIMTLVEQNKAYVLQPADKKPTKKNQKGPQNPFSRRFSLIPSGDFKSLEELFPTINVTKENFITDATFNKIYKKIPDKDTSILILQNITDKPISYELWNLLQLRPEEQNLQLAKQGISEHFIESRVTIRPLETSRKWLFSSYKLHGPSNSKWFYVLETLNNKLYRFLYPWTINPRRYVNNDSQETEHKLPTKIERTKINGLLNYLEINTKYKNYTDRISAYQKIKENNLKKMFFITGEPDIDALVEESLIQIDSSKIKSESLFRINDVVNKMVKNAERPLDMIGFVIYNNKIFDVFIDTIVGMYKEFYTDILKNDTRVEFKFSEVFSTYLSDLQILKNNFSRELGNIYLKRIEEDKNEIESISDRSKLLIYIEDIIKETLDKILTYNNNIYQSLIFKSNLLKVGLI